MSLKTVFVIKIFIKDFRSQLPLAFTSPLSFDFDKKPTSSLRFYPCDLLRDQRLTRGGVIMGIAIPRSSGQNAAFFVRVFTYNSMIRLSHWLRSKVKNSVLRLGFPVSGGSPSSSYLIFRLCSCFIIRYLDSCCSIA